MSRARWKVPIVSMLENGRTPTEIVYRYSRFTVVLPFMINQLVEIHTGRHWRRLRLGEKMLGHRCGEFALTRTYPPHGRTAEVEKRRKGRTVKKK